VTELRSRFDLTGKKVVLYAGMFGRANAVKMLLRSAQLEKRQDVRFVLIGDGFHHGDVAEAAAGNPKLVIVEPQPRHAVFKWFKLADLSLVPFIDLPVLAANSPSKFFDSLAAGTPVIVTNPGWTRQFVEEHECGWYVPPEDPESLTQAIDQALDSPWDLARAGANGRRIAVTEFDRVAMARKIEEMMVGKR
ncbi:MAG: glycosyltransferase, partial [Candidatus Latescibacterota bacterium]